MKVSSACIRWPTNVPQQSWDRRGIYACLTWLNGMQYVKEKRAYVVQSGHEFQNTYIIEMEAWAL